jgi:hypothetical protein
MYLKNRLLCHVAALALLPAAVFGASSRSYQVTGPVVAVTPTSITVEKDGENWEIARDPSATGDANAKVGDRVTVQYRMTATKIEVKPARTDSAKAATKDGDSSAKKKK